MLVRLTSRSGQTCFQVELTQVLVVMDISKGVFERRKSISTYWHNKASDLHASAGVLWEATRRTPDPQTGFSHAVACWSVYQMLCGMSLELLFKAILVAKGIEPKATHKLDILAEEAGIRFQPNDTGLLRILSEASIWDGRYPVPKKAEHYRALNDLVWEHLHDRVSDTHLDIRRGNDKLGWESFNRLWRVASDVYWAHC